MTNHRWPSTLFTLAAAVVAIAPLRTSASPQARFDVVSVKPCEGDGPGVNRPAPRPGGGRSGAAPYAAQTSPGRVYWDCATLAQLIDQAYADEASPLLNSAPRLRADSFHPKRVRGGPSWIESDAFTIEAKAPVEVTTPVLAGRENRVLGALPASLGQALRAVLEDRFQVKVRRATEQQDMYALTIAGNGLNKDRVRPLQPGDCVTIDEYFAADPASRRDVKICGRIRSTMTALEYSGFTMAQLAQDLSRQMDRYVIDRTSLEGVFSFDVVTQGESGDTTEDRLVRGLARLGLRIEGAKAPAEYLVIESVQKLRPDGAR